MPSQRHDSAKNIRFTFEHRQDEPPNVGIAFAGLMMEFVMPDALALIIATWLLIATSLVLLCTSYLDCSAELVWFVVFVTTAAGLVVRGRSQDRPRIR